MLRGLTTNMPLCMYTSMDISVRAYMYTFSSQRVDISSIFCILIDSLELSQVLVGTPKVYAQLISEGKLLSCHINLVIVDECHKSIEDNILNVILRTFLSCDNVPRIIGLAVPVFNLTQEPGRLGLEIEKVEAAFHCGVETANDILSIIR